MFTKCGCLLICDEFGDAQRRYTGKYTGHLAKGKDWPHTTMELKLIKSFIVTMPDKQNRIKR